MRLGRLGRSRAPSSGLVGASYQPDATGSIKNKDKLERRVILDSIVNGLRVRGDRVVSKEAANASTCSRFTSANESTSGCCIDTQLMKSRTSQPTFLIVAGRVYCTRRAQR